MWDTQWVYRRDMFEELYGGYGYKEKEPETTLFHTGTRYQHLMELREIWEIGLDVLRTMNQEYLTEGDQYKITQLESAIFLLTKHIDNISGFGKYGQAEHDLRYKIDNVPKDPSKIPDDRRRK
jgi:hypothetical protein